MASYANASMYEQQNEDSMDRLFNKVHSLREVTINIHNDSENQRGLLGESSSVFDQFSATMQATSRQLAKTTSRFAKSNRVTVTIVAAFVLLWALWFFFM